MSNSRKLMTVGGGGGAGTYVEDVFSTYLFNGTHNGVNPPQDIVNGINLRDEGGLVWTKTRSSGFTHQLFDTERGVNQAMETSSAGASAEVSNSLTAFNSDGFTLGGGAFVNTASYVSSSWTFAKQEGFFDMVSYTGDGVTGREIPHNLGSTPGMLIVKRIDDGGYDWMVQSRALGGTKYLSLNQTNGAIPWSAPWNNIAATSDVFTVGSDAQVNSSNSEYVAYLFADDAQGFGPSGDESIIKCGSYTGTSNTSGPEIDLGWEPQFLLIKKTGGSENWVMLDTMRGLPIGGNFNRLNPNSSLAEADNVPGLEVTATGFKLTGPFAEVNDNGDFIYMAIRRPHKPAEEFEPTELFAMQQDSSSVRPAWVSGFPVDMAWNKDFSSGSNFTSARLMDKRYLSFNLNSEAYTSTSYAFDYSEGWNENLNLTDWQSWMWRRAPGFFDVVTYAGTSGDAAGKDKPHGLGVVPEMMWVKNLDGTWGANWLCYHKDVGETKFLEVNSGIAPTTASYAWEDTAPTAETFHVSSDGYVNGTDDYIALLWASVPGICSVGSYVATGTVQDIDCGFSNGARFVLIKRTDGIGDWYYWDTVRGITTSVDPYLALNQTYGANTTTDWIDPLPSGFSLENSAGNDVNINGGQYIYMAIA